MKNSNMEAREHKVIEFDETEAKSLVGLDIVACQIAEGGAMGIHGGVFLVSSDSKVYFTCLLKPSDYTGFKKHTPLDILTRILPALEEFDLGLMGHGVSVPRGFNYRYLGLGNHPLIKDCIYEEVDEMARKRLEDYPDRILYNLWLDVVLDILPISKDAVRI